jgi:C_GCAxxG_C_C family probable redox protein
MEGMHMNKEEMLEAVYQKAKAYELQGGNCAQCSLAAIFEVLGVDDENVIRAATGFADGVGLSGDGHCGALSGGTIAISYLFGRKKEDLAKMGKQIKALLLAKKFHKEFVEEFSTCRCHDIQIKQFGRFFNLYEMEDMKAAMAAGMAEQCATLVGKAARMALNIILEEQAKKEKKVELPVV